MRTAVLAPPVTETLLDRESFERAWHGVPGGEAATPAPATTQLTISRNTSGDFQDRQVYIWVDGESWGKIKYGRPLTREIPAGTHRIRANNTLFNDTLDFTARSGRARARAVPQRHAQGRMAVAGAAARDLPAGEARARSLNDRADKPDCRKTVQAAPMLPD